MSHCSFPRRNQQHTAEMHSHDLARTPPHCWPASNLQQGWLRLQEIKRFPSSTLLHSGPCCVHKSKCAHTSNSSSSWICTSSLALSALLLTRSPGLCSKVAWRAIIASLTRSAALPCAALSLHEGLLLGKGKDFWIYRNEVPVRGCIAVLHRVESLTVSQCTQRGELQCFVADFLAEHRCFAQAATVTAHADAF